MTVMIDRFIGLHPAVIREGLFSKLKEGEIRLLIALMDRSEYLCTRELTLTDAQIRNLVGAAPRTLCNARKKLQELGLIRYRSGGGNKYIYVICDPTTGDPYPGDPKTKVLYQKRTETQPPEVQAKSAPSRTLQPLKQDLPLESYGLPMTEW